MGNPRSTGLLLLAIGILTLIGNTMDILPPQAFWAGLLTYPIGGYLFFKGSREAIERAEVRHARALNPTLRNEQAEAYAQQQRAQVVNPHATEHHRPARHAAAPTTVPTHANDELVLYEVDEGGESADEEDGGFQVTTDVSFPLEVQEQRSLAEQLERLQRLHEEGVIDAEELAVAKAKLLG